MAHHNPPTCMNVILKAGLQFVFLLLLVLPMAYLHEMSPNYQLFHRGFFCDDQSLKHPYLDQTVPTSKCMMLWVVLSIFVIVLLESLRSYAAKGRAKPIKKSRTPWIAVELYRHFGYFILGAVSCVLFTEIAKYTIGRLRPHFLTICDPEFTDELCKDTSPQRYERFVTEEETTICRGLVENGGKYTVEHLHEARLSFLSGHSSFSFFCATFLVVYLQFRLSNFPQTQALWFQIIYRTLKVSRPFLQFGLFVLALWISLTRISDYFHHPLDVITGVFVGISFACLTLVVCANLSTKHTIFWQKDEQINATEEVPANKERNITSNSYIRQETESSQRDGLPYIDETPRSENYRMKPSNTTPRSNN